MRFFIGHWCVSGTKWPHAVKAFCTFQCATVVDGQMRAQLCRPVHLRWCLSSTLLGQGIEEESGWLSSSSGLEGLCQCLDLPRLVRCSLPSFMRGFTVLRTRVRFERRCEWVLQNMCVPPEYSRLFRVCLRLRQHADASWPQFALANV